MTAEMDSILAEARALLTPFRSDTAVNSRTGETLTCWIRRPTGRIEEPVEGFPHFVRTLRWEIVLKDGANVRNADVLNVTGKGAYTTIAVYTPETLSVETVAIGVRADLADLRLVTNATVQFRQASTQALTPDVNVTLIPLSPDAATDAAGNITATHELIWKEPVTFTNGHSVQQGDFVSASFLQTGEAQLDYPQRWTLAGWTIARFKDQ